MAASIIYALGAAGFCTQTSRFWVALIWPYYLGALLGAALSEKGVTLSVKTTDATAQTTSGKGSSDD